VGDPTPMPSDAEQGTDEGLASTRPPASFVPVRTWVVQTLRELSELRAEVLAEVSPAGAGPVPDLDSIAHHMVLVASELATNALRHGIPPTIVQLLRDGRTYLLDVADHDLTTQPYVAGSRPPGLGGFGLQIARRLALDVGWYATATTKHVWARFPVPD
jgi:serine/threonine-protein kinase RsbW